MVYVLNEKSTSSRNYCTQLVATTPAVKIHKKENWIDIWDVNTGFQKQTSQYSKKIERYLQYILTFKDLKKNPRHKVENNIKKQRSNCKHTEKWA